MKDLKKAATLLADELRRSAVALEKGSLKDLCAAQIKVTVTMAALMEQQANTLAQLEETTKLLKTMIQYLKGTGVSDASARGEARARHNGAARGARRVGLHLYVPRSRLQRGPDRVRWLEVLAHGRCP